MLQARSRLGQALCRLSLSDHQKPQGRPLEITVLITRNHPEAPPKPFENLSITQEITLEFTIANLDYTFFTVLSQDFLANLIRQIEISTLNLSLVFIHNLKSFFLYLKSFFYLCLYSCSKIQLKPRLFSYSSHLPFYFVTLCSCLLYCFYSLIHYSLLT